MTVITRFILANTEQLHEKIKDMSDRIRQLEDALQQAYSQLSQAPHPLLSENLLQIKTSQELFGVAGGWIESKVQSSISTTERSE